VKYLKISSLIVLHSLSISPGTWITKLLILFFNYLLPRCSPWWSLSRMACCKSKTPLRPQPGSSGSPHSCPSSSKRCCAFARWGQPRLKRVFLLQGQRERRKRSFWIFDFFFFLVFQTHTQKKKTKRKKERQKKRRMLGQGSENFESFGKGGGVILL